MAGLRIRPPLLHGLILRSMMERAMRLFNCFPLQVAACALWLLATAAALHSLGIPIRGPVVCVVSGGNNDVSRYAEVVARLAG